MRNVSLSQLGDYKAARKSIYDETRALDQQVSHDKIWPGQ